LAQPRPLRAADGPRLEAAVRALHLAGVKAADPNYEWLGKLSVTLDDIKRFRQLDSKCPGPLDLRHRDHHGTLAQGVATSVGMGTAVSRRRQT
jgi:Transketolase, thiamine diphosphate binding domain